MKSVKTLSVLILTTFLMVVLVGCSGTNTSTTQTTASEKKEISLPKGWAMKDAISAEEVGTIVGETMTYFPEANSNAQAGKPSCGYTVAGKDASKISFKAFVSGGDKEFEGIKGFAVKDSVKDVTGIGDKAYICDFTNSTSAIVVQKGETVIRVDWTPKTYSKFEKVELGKKLAGKLLENMYK